MTTPFHGTPRRFPPSKPRLVLTALGFKYGVAAWRVYMPDGEISPPLFTFGAVAEYMFQHAVRKSNAERAIQLSQFAKPS